MIRKSLVAAAAGIAVLAAASLAPSRAQAMPLGLPAGAIDQIDMTQAVALCFYIDGWNGPGLYQCGYRLRRGLGWHGHRDGHRHRSHHSGGGKKYSGGKKHKH
jgi:hypothetical protein